MADSQADAVPTSPIIMKVDAPSEESENNDNEALGHSICSPSTRPMSSIFANPFEPKTPTPSASSASNSVLRPSQLSQHVASSKPFSLTPGKLNPFMRTVTEDPDTEDRKVESTNGETPKFVPLITSTTASSSTCSLDGMPKEAKPAATTTNFVFGQNLQERVVKDTASSSSNASSGVSSTSDECKPSSSTTYAAASTNGTSSKEEMLFSSAIKETPMNEAHGVAPGKSLTESAREYEAQRNNKRKYEEVETKTGEEDETNVMQISCKLFAYDKGVGNWQERGRGILRLNDFVVQHTGDTNCSNFTQSRLVFRTSGVHKVILNTKIWAEMTVEQASAKSLRFTAIDTAGEIKVFLVMALPEENKHLFKLLQERRANEQKRQNLKKQTTDDSSPRKLDSTSSDNMDTSVAEEPSSAMSEDSAANLTESSVDEDITNGSRQESVIQSSSN